MKLDLLQTFFVAAVTCVLALALYDRFVAPQRFSIGVVDVGEVYRLKEAEIAKAIGDAPSDDERRRAQGLASAFASRLTQALRELSEECGCLVMVRSAVASPEARTVDMTKLLLAKVS